MAVSATVNEAGPISHQELWVKYDDSQAICPWHFIPVLPYLVYIRCKKKTWVVPLERKAVISGDVEGSGDSEWACLSVKIHVWIKQRTISSIRSCQCVTKHVCKCTCWDLQYRVWDINHTHPAHFIINVLVSLMPFHLKCEIIVVILALYWHIRMLFKCIYIYLYYIYSLYISVSVDIVYLIVHAHFLIFTSRLDFCHLTLT